MAAQLPPQPELCRLPRCRGEAWQVHTPSVYRHDLIRGWGCGYLVDSLSLPMSSRYRVAMDTDAKEFDGHSRVDPGSEYIATATAWDSRDYSITVYIPCRTGLVLFRDSS